MSSKQIGLSQSGDDKNALRISEIRKSSSSITKQGTYSGTTAALFEWTCLTAITAACQSTAPVAPGSSWQSYCLPLAASTVLMSCMAARKLYSLAFLADIRAYQARLADNAALIGMVAVILSMIMHPGWDNPSKLWLAAAWFVAAFAACCASRWLVSRQFHAALEQGAATKRVVLLGYQSLAGEFMGWAGSNRLGVQLVAQFSASAAAAGETDAAEAQAWLTAFLQFQKQNNVDAVVLALPELHSAAARALMEKLALQPVTLLAVPAEGIEAQPDFVFPAACGRHTLALIELAQPPVRTAGRLAKAALDRLAALVALVIFSPIMLGCVIGVMIASPGPVLFRQPRIGHRNRVFQVLKFRTMHVTANPNKKLTERNDPRVFRFGSVMRKLSFDELPQLFNVLKGDMSLVGPRPHMPEATAAGRLYHDAVADYELRHGVKPGITGWAQVNGWRGPTETIHQIQNRVDHDFHYIRNWSLWLDVKILIKTVFVGFTGENAF